MERIPYPHLEWEISRVPIKVSQVDDRTELPRGPKEILIERDEDYSLRATLHFEDSAFPRHLTEQSAVAGSFPERFDIQGSDSGLVIYTLESCFIGETTISQGERQRIKGTANLLLHGLRAKYGNEREGTHLTEWYLNGPEDKVFCGVTARKLSRSFSRIRKAFTGDKVDSILMSGHDSGSGVDFLRVQAGELQFLVAKVPRGIGPSWSSNIGIEYRKAWGRIPDAHEREKIEELCSFVLGRQLLSVGYTMYDKDEYLVEAYARNPWGNARSLCSKPDMSPVRIENIPRGKADEVISELLPAYYEMREPLRLKEALWNYWISRLMPIGTNLPILAAAIESVINGWFKYKSKSQGVYMNKEEFEALLKEEIEHIAKKLEGKSGSEGIVVNFQRAYQAGIMQRYRIFFDEISLSVGDSEWKAINERHRFVHGHVRFDKEDPKQVIRHAATLETLLHKIFLKSLGYTGTFIDRSVLGWKDKELS